jgi:2'-5' RNA ligase
MMIVYKRNKMKSVLEYLTKQKGLYVAVRPKSNEVINKLKNTLNIDNNHEDYHVTVIYSRTYDELEVIPQKEYQAKLKQLHLFGDDFLVVMLDCPELVDRHKQLMKNYDLTYDCDEYIPHITLSYNAQKECSKEFLDKINSGVLVNDFDGLEAHLTLSDEYQEDLNLDYGK